MIKRHLEALAEFDEQALADALEEEGDRWAAADDDDEGSVQSQDNMSGVSGGSVEGIKELNEDDEAEDKVEDLIVCSRRYKQALTGMKVHDAGVQGKKGGRMVRGQKAAKKAATLGEAVGRWKVLSLMVESLDVKPHLWDLLLNHTVMAAYEAGDLLLVPHGTIIKEVSVSHMKAERAVLEAREMKKP